MGKLSIAERSRSFLFWLLLGILTMVVCLSGWLYLVHIGLLPGRPTFCSSGDRDFIDCVRNWIDPVAAIFTIAAIVYAALQYREATRASDAAVRASLVRLRDDLEADYEPIAAMVKVHMDIQRDMMRTMMLGKPDEPPLGILRSIHDSGQELYTRVQRVLGRLSFVDELNDKRNGAGKALVGFYGSIWQTALDQHFLQGQITVEDFLRREWHKLGPAFKDAHQKLYDYSQRLRDEINTVTGTIAEFDESVLRNARRLADVRRDEYLEAVRRAASGTLARAASGEGRRD